MTDCEDLMQLVTEDKGVPRDRNQRRYVLSLREARLAKHIRRFYQAPTQCLLADGLREAMVAGQLIATLRSGTVELSQEFHHHAADADQDDDGHRG